MLTSKPSLPGIQAQASIAPSPSDQPTPRYQDQDTEILVLGLARLWINVYKTPAGHPVTTHRSDSNVSNSKYQVESKPESDPRDATPATSHPALERAVEDGTEHQFEPGEILAMDQQGLGSHASRSSNLVLDFAQQLLVGCKSLASHVSFL